MDINVCNPKILYLKSDFVSLSSKIDTACFTCNVRLMKTCYKNPYNARPPEENWMRSKLNSMYSIVIQA